MKIRSYCEKIGHRVSGRLTLVANTMGVRIYMDEAKTAYKINTITGEIEIRKRRNAMEYKAPKAEDISYYYNTKGYMMTYKGQPIGGAGIDRTARGCSSNLKLFKRSAEATKRELVAGGGSQYMKDCILKIDQAEEGAHADRNHG